MNKSNGGISKAVPLRQKINKIPGDLYIYSEITFAGLTGLYEQLLI